MNQIEIESVIEALALVGSAVGTLLLAIIGFLTEQAGLQNVLSGHITVGAWELWMGTLAIVAGVYLVGYRQFWRRLHLRYAR